MKLHDLRPAEGAKKARKRVGRGISAGQGKTAGRGTKGQNSRSGGGVPPYFEGGQLPLVRRLPWKRGFNPISRVEYAPVNLSRLSIFEEGALVTPETLADRGVIRDAETPVKILADGELDRPLRICVHKVSEAAREKIVAAGGEIELLSDD